MAVAKDGFSARYYLVHQEPPESELASWEPLSCPSIRAVSMHGEERLASGRAEENSPAFVVASEFREWGLYPPARQRLIRVKQMSAGYSVL